MRRRITLSTIAATATLLTLGLAVLPSAQAQGAGGGRGQGIGGRGQGFGGPGMMFGGGPNAMRDPMRSAEPALVQRDDVRHELMLDGRQQQQLDEAVKKGQQDAMAKGRTAFQDMRQKMQNGGQNPRDMTPEDRQAFMQEMQKQMQDTMAPIMAEQDKAVESVLTKRQIARLHQLDLQWRSALSLNDPKIGDQVGLTPEQKQKVAAIYQEYTTAQRQAMQGVFGGFGGRGAGRRNNANANGGPAGGNNANGGQDNTNGQGNGQDNANAGQQNQQGQPGQPGQFNRPNLDPQAMQERMQQAQKGIEKARKAGADKVLALLTPEQKAQWNKMTGTPFTFKENSPVSTDNPNN